MSTVQIALLDADNVYLGMDEIEEKDLDPDLHVALPGGCDLPPNRYRWDGAQKTFVPIKGDAVKTVETTDTLAAIALGFAALAEQGAVLPAETERWMKFHFKSIDFAGAVQTTASQALVQLSLEGKK